MPLEMMWFDTAKGLQTHHIVDAVFGEVHDFRRQQPAFAELGSHVDDGLALIGQVEDILDGGEVGELFPDLIEFL